MNIMNDLITMGSLVVAVVSLGLFLLEFRGNRQGRQGIRGSRGAKMTEQHSMGIIRRAIRRAQAIIGQAEVEGVKVVAASKFQSRALEEKFEKELEKQSDDLAQKMGEEVTKKTDAVLAGLGNKLENLLEGEASKAKAEVTAYKEKQMAAIDERIVAVTERTIAKVLKQKLSLSQHADLVYEALEKAKAEEFI